MVIEKTTTKGYVISTNRKRLDVSRIHQFLRSTYWARDIPRNVVAKSIRNSLCFAVYYHRELVGFARMITDRATFAYLADVFILPEHRGRGVGRKLVAAILAHRNLQGLRRVLLSTHDAQLFYAQFGFRRLANPERYLTLHNPDIYQRNPKSPAAKGIKPRIKPRSAP